jgi:hypothetical protein
MRAARSIEKRLHDLGSTPGLVMATLALSALFLACESAHAPATVIVGPAPPGATTSATTAATAPPPSSPFASTEPAAAAAPAADERSAPPPSDGGAPTKRAERRRAGAADGRAPPSDWCDPPYAVDVDGNKYIKDGCW